MSEEHDYLANLFAEMDRRAFMKKLAIAGACLATGVKVGNSSALAAPARKSARGKLTLALHGEPKNLFPLNQLGDNPGIQIMENIYSPLARFDYQNGKVIPELATSWKTKGDLAWIIELRKGIQWHKGYGEFGAEDVAYGINKVIENKWSRRGFLANITEARPVGSHTVEIQLKKPYPGFILNGMVCLPGLQICAKAHKEKGEGYLRDPVGTGPFEFVSWKSGSHLVLRRNKNYWKKNLPYLDEIEVRFIRDPFTRRSQLLTGEIQWMDFPDTKDVTVLKKNPDLRVFSTPGWTWDFINFHITKAPFNKKEVRQAIAWAVDRQEIVDMIYYGEAVTTDIPFPRGFPGSDRVKRVFPDRADVEKAKMLLAKGGYPKGFRTPCITSGKENLRRELELVAAQLGKVGIQIKIENLDNATFSRRCYRKFEFDMALEDISIVTPDPDAPVRRFWHSSYYEKLMNPGIREENLDRYLDNAMTGKTLDIRLNNYGKALEFMQDHCTYIYLVNKNYFRIMPKNFKGYEGTPQETAVFFEKCYWGA